MCSANLLIHIESFEWEDLTVDRSRALIRLTNAYNVITDNNDVIYNHPQSFAFKLSWGYFHEILSYNDDELNFNCPWLGHDSQTILIKLFSHSTSKIPSYNLQNLEAEFIDENNGMFGLDERAQAKYVHDELSWRNLHLEYIKANPNLRRTNYNYFRRFYIPELTEDANAINNSIKRGKVHPIFKRLDTPAYVDENKTLHGEQIQMHFADDERSALNIDGTWKHKSCKIPKEAAEQLIKWGFLLPE